MKEETAMKRVKEMLIDRKRGVIEMEKEREGERAK